LQPRKFASFAATNRYNEKVFADRRASKKHLRNGT